MTQNEENIPEEAMKAIKEFLDTQSFGNGSSALKALQTLKKLETLTKTMRNDIYEKLEEEGVDRSVTIGEFTIQKVKPQMVYSIPADKLLELKDENPDAFIAITKPSIELTDDERAELEAEQMELMAKEAEISARLENDRLAREPEIIDDIKTVQTVAKIAHIEIDEKVKVKGSYKVVKAKKDENK